MLLCLLFVLGGRCLRNSVDAEFLAANARDEKRASNLLACRDTFSIHAISISFP